MGLKSVVKHLTGKGGISFFIDDPKEAKKMQKFLQTKIKDVRLINLDKDGGDEANHVVYAVLFEGSIREDLLGESGILYRAGVKKYGKEGMKKIQSAAGKGEGHEEIGKIKDKYEKGKKEGKITEGREPLWTKETVKDAINQIKKGLKNAVPYLDDIGTGFGGGSIIGKISLDPKKDWPNGIIQNSRWGLIHFFPDGTLDTIRMSGWSDYKTRKKVPILRKSKNKSLKQAIDRMGRYFTVVRTKHPDTK